MGFEPNAPYMGRPGGPTNQDAALAGKRELERTGQWGTASPPLTLEERQRRMRGLRWRRWAGAILFGLLALWFAPAALNAAFNDIRNGSGYLVLVGLFALLALHQGWKAVSTEVPRSQ